MRSRQTIIADIREANDALEITTYDSLVVEEDATWLYVDKLNGNDDDAAQYFIDNPTAIHNQSVPFASYSGINGMVEFWEARKAALDARFVDKWPIFMNASGDVVWVDSVPTNSIGNLSKPLIWIGIKWFDLQTDRYNTYYRCTAINSEMKVRGIKQTSGYSFDYTSFLYCNLLNIIIGNASGNGQINTCLYKTQAVNLGLQTRGDGSQYPRISNCTILNISSHNNGGEIKTSSFYYPQYLKVSLCRNSFITAFKSSTWWGWVCMTDSLADGGYNASSQSIQTSYGDRNETNNVAIVCFDYHVNTSHSQIDPKFIDIENELYVKQGSPTLRAGLHGQDIGLGLGYAQRDATNNYLLDSVKNGSFKNVEIDSFGNLLLSHTGLNPTSATSNTIELNPTASVQNDAYKDLYIRIEDEAQNLIEEHLISSYDGATKVATIATTFNIIPTTSSLYRISGEVETTLMNIETVIDKLLFFEDNKEFYGSGQLKSGVYDIQLKVSNLLNGGRIPQTGDADYNATEHDYKKQTPDYVRVDSLGRGSADIGFDDSTSNKISANFEQLKFKIW